MNLTPYIELLRNIIRIPSTSGNEKAVADLLEGFMLSLGLNVFRSDNNVWVESKPSESGVPTILLNAHIDTVKPSPSYTRDPYSPDVEGDAIYGLGSNDDGGSLVALLAAYMELSQRQQPYRLVFSATAQEENCGPQGIDTVLDKFGEVSLGIIGEPTGMQMAVAERGLLVLDCVSKGKTGHAARQEGVNAIYEAMRDIEWLRNYRFERVSEHLGEVKMTVTIINAGTLHNVVPEQCSFTVDVRPNGEYSNAQVLEIIRSHVGASVTPRSMKHNSSSISLEHPVVQRGLALGLECFGSPTTSNQTRCSFDTLKIGPGESSRSHSADEFILISEIENAVKLYCALLDGLKL